MKEIVFIMEIKQMRTITHSLPIQLPDGLN
jgi:hypothetical protein